MRNEHKITNKVEIKTGVYLTYKNWITNMADHTVINPDNYLELEITANNQTVKSYRFMGIKIDEKLGKILDFNNIKCRLDNATLAQAQPLIDMYFAGKKHNANNYAAEIAEREERKRNGYCFKCHSYCYGDCEAN